jgi:plastocyanin
MRRTLFAFLALAVIAAVGCFNESSLDPFGTGTSTSGGTGGGGGGGADSAGALDTASVLIFDNGYTPSTVTVAPGGTVTWVWTGNNAHGVSFDDSTIAASPIQSVGSFTVRFPRAGFFSFFCTVHGRTIESGTVTVR